jgi:LAGLIDADG DNA endonuclease family
MCDGSFNKQNQTIKIALNSFIKSDVELLKLVMLNNFGFDCRVEHLRKEQYYLVIRRNQLVKAQDLLKDNFVPSMLYKLGL